eukprot:9000800-Alexandrium_andersonii.AAC.1
MHDLCSPTWWPWHGRARAGAVHTQPGMRARSNWFKGERTCNSDSRVEQACGLSISATAAPCFGLESVCLPAE